MASVTLARLYVSIETDTLSFELFLHSLTSFRVVHEAFYVSRERFNSKVMVIVIRRLLDLLRGGLRAMFPLTCTLFSSNWPNLTRNSFR